MRTHIFPPRRTFRDIARRPASICLDVIQAGSNKLVQQNNSKLKKIDRIEKDRKFE
jgi:hypothetical protein